MLWSLLSEQIVTSEKQIVEIQLNRNLRSEIKVAVKCHFDPVSYTHLRAHET